MNNAGIGRECPAMPADGQSFDEYLAQWQAVIDVNVWGVVYMSMLFGPVMRSQKEQSVIINTGSKQGITCPPGNAGYNVSKAVVKTYTEQREWRVQGSEVHAG
jgi:NAD(P)-dependent dehydrogenase (short-subunit alcohol dehydrogenase family)